MPRNVFTPQTIGPELVATDRRIQQAAIRGLRLAARLGRGAVVKEIRGNKPFPVVDLKELVSSPKVTPIDNGAILEVTAPHGTYQEFGTKPHTPPLQAIRDWASRKVRRRKKPSAKKRRPGPKGAEQPDGDKPEWPGLPGRRPQETRENREIKARRRAKAKAKREAALNKEAEKLAGAVWITIRKHGTEPKRYYERASKQFQGHVDKRVAAAVAKVNR